MTHPEIPRQTRFDELLQAEIARMDDPSVSEPPAQTQALTLAEYRDAMEQSLGKNYLPAAQQITNFLEEFQQRGGEEIRRNAHAGWKVIPVILPREHGYPVFDNKRVKAYGYLYVYVLREDGLTARTDKLAYMNAVLPLEVLSNAVPVTEKILDTTEGEKFFKEFEEKVKRLVEMMKA